MTKALFVGLWSAFWVWAIGTHSLLAIALIVGVGTIIATISDE